MKTILKKHILFLISGSFFLPTFVFAQQKLSADDFKAGIDGLDGFIRALTTGAVKSTGVLLMAVAMVVFLLGIVQYLWGLREGKPATVDTGKQFMTYGLVALFVMFSVYGIVKLAQSVLFNGKDINTITIPELNFKAQSSTGASGGANNPSPLVPPASRVVDVKNPGTSQPSTSNTAPTQPNQPRQPSSSAEPYKCSPGFECTIPETNGQIGLCNATGNACASNAIQQGGCTSGKHYDSEARGCVPDDTSSEPYKCSPGFDCTIPGTGQTGVCNATGNACASNAISEPANPQGGQ